MRTLKLRRNPSASDLSEAVKEITLPSVHQADGVRVPASLVALVDPSIEPMPMVKFRPWWNGTPRWVRDATANDSDKSFSVPTGKVWDLRLAYMKLVCTATVGNRTPVINVLDSSSNVLFQRYAANATAGQTVEFEIGAGTDSASLTLPPVGNAYAGYGVPNFLLTEGMSVRLRDSNGVDPAADDLTAILHYVEYDA